MGSRSDSPPAEAVEDPLLCQHQRNGKKCTAIATRVCTEEGNYKNMLFCGIYHSGIPKNPNAYEPYSHPVPNTDSKTEWTPKTTSAHPAPKEAPKEAAEEAACKRKKTPETKEKKPHKVADFKKGIPCERKKTERRQQVAAAQAEKRQEAIEAKRSSKKDDENVPKKKTNGNVDDSKPGQEEEMGDSDAENKPAATTGDAKKTIPASSSNGGGVYERMSKGKTAQDEKCERLSKGKTANKQPPQEKPKPQPEFQKHTKDDVEVTSASKKIAAKTVEEQKEVLMQEIGAVKTGYCNTTPFNVILRLSILKLQEKGIKISDETKEIVKDEVSH